MGLAMRGTANNQETALLMGISTKRVFAMVWGIAFVTAAIAGIFLANVMVVNIGLTFTAISAFPAIILGGLGKHPWCNHRGAGYRCHLEFSWRVLRPSRWRRGEGCDALCGPVFSPDVQTLRSLWKRRD